MRNPTNQQKADYHASEARWLLNRSVSQNVHAVKAQAHATLALYFQGELGDPTKLEGIPARAVRAPKIDYKEPVRAILARYAGERITPSLVERAREDVAAAGYSGVVIAYPQTRQIEYRPADEYAIAP